MPLPAPTTPTHPTSAPWAQPVASSPDFLSSSFPSLPPPSPHHPPSPSPSTQLFHPSKPRISNLDLLLPRQLHPDQLKIVIQHLRIPQTTPPPILIHPLPKNPISLLDLGVQDLELCGVDGRRAVEAVVEGEAGEGLEVGEVGVVACGAEMVEGGYDLVASVVEDPGAEWGGVFSLAIRD